MTLKLKLGILSLATLKNTYKIKEKYIIRT